MFKISTFMVTTFFDINLILIWIFARKDIKTGSLAVNFKDEIGIPTLSLREMEEIKQATIFYPDLPKKTLKEETKSEQIIPGDRKDPTTILPKVICLSNIIFSSKHFSVENVPLALREYTSQYGRKSCTSK